MLILTNCLSNAPDEGCIKVANSLVKRLKRCRNDVQVVSYERSSDSSDMHFTLNKLLLHPRLASMVWKNRKSFLYIPFPSKPIAAALRAFVLSLYSGGRLKLLVAMSGELTPAARLLYRISRAKFYVLSKAAETQFSGFLSKKRVVYLKTGVDTTRFCPVDDARKLALKAAFGFDPAAKIILHVGHLKQGRNVQQLLKIDPQYQVVLVASTLTKQEQDADLRQQLLSRPNIRVIDDYLPNIQEIYQLADVYFFPVVQTFNCIDVPLSCLEAAACNVPVVTTPYGEMQELISREGFIPLHDMTDEAINTAIASALALGPVNTRDAVLGYDWEHALTKLQDMG